MICLCCIACCFCCHCPQCLNITSETALPIKATLYVGYHLEWGTKVYIPVNELRWPPCLCICKINLKISIKTFCIYLYIYWISGEHLQDHWFQRYSCDVTYYNTKPRLLLICRKFLIIKISKLFRHDLHTFVCQLNKERRMNSSLCHRFHLPPLDNG